MECHQRQQRQGAQFVHLVEQFLQFRAGGHQRRQIDEPEPLQGEVGGAVVGPAGERHRQHQSVQRHMGAERRQFLPAGRGQIQRTAVYRTPGQPRQRQRQQRQPEAFVQGISLEHGGATRQVGHPEAEGTKAQEPCRHGPVEQLRDEAPAGIGGQQGHGFLLTGLGGLRLPGARPARHPPWECRRPRRNRNASACPWP